MKGPVDRFLHIAFVFLATAAPAATQELVPETEPRTVSAFGRYEGYSEERFEEWVTSSVYVEMRDGVRLAVDVTRPAVDGHAVGEPLPVLWTHSRYHRNPGRIMSFLNPGADTAGIRSMADAWPALQRLVRHGYVLAAVAVRGSGASFGRYEGLFSERETADAAEITAWLAEQPWCDGKVGMYGGSYLGITQYMTASLDPPALGALFPDVAAFDMYDLVYPGGVFREDMIADWDALTRRMDREWTAPPVEGDGEGDPDAGEELLRRAIAEHEGNWEVLEGYRAGRFRDHEDDELAYARHGPSAFLEGINAASVPAYHFGGWHDVFVLDALLWFANYTGPQKLAIGAWPHGGAADPALMAERQRLTAIEQLRWYDRWLKGIENGVDEEPPIHYAVIEEPGAWHWRSASAWPPPEARAESLYLAAGPSGSVDSPNDGTLASSAPESEEAFDAYAVDPTTTTGALSRWNNAVGSAPVMAYPGLAENDERALTYTTAPLERDLLVVGHPVVTLFATSSSGDADLHVLLEEVDEAGEVRYVTEGVLRASHRRLAEAPWNNLGLPYQRSFEEDVEPLPADDPAEIALDLHPTATLFDAGHRLRLVVMGADADNTEAPRSLPAELRVFRDEERPSRLLLPVIPGE